MKRQVALVTLLVADYDTAIDWYTDKLGFVLLEDKPMGGGKRWVRIAASADGGAELLLAVASDDAQRARIGDQTGGRVGFFLTTDDFWRDYHAMQAKGVTFLETPREESYATVVVLRDLYGNTWDLLEPTA